MTGGLPSVGKAFVWRTRASRSDDASGHCSGSGACSRCRRSPPSTDQSCATPSTQTGSAAAEIIASGPGLPLSPSGGDLVRAELAAHCVRARDCDSAAPQTSVKALSGRRCSDVLGRATRRARSIELFIRLQRGGTNPGSGWPRRANACARRDATPDGLHVVMAAPRLERTSPLADGRTRHAAEGCINSSFTMAFGDRLWTDKTDHQCLCAKGPTEGHGRHPASSRLPF